MTNMRTSLGCGETWVPLTGESADFAKRFTKISELTTVANLLWKPGMSGGQSSFNEYLTRSLPSLLFTSVISQT